MRRPLPSPAEPPPPVRLLLSGSVALITLDNAPVNALSEQVRIHLRKNVQEACDNAQVKFIVVMAAKGSRCFSSGADIKEFTQLAPPYLPDVLNEMEASRKPVIAAMDGPALGGGFELAMACHYRIATSRATLALPEVSLGILPGAGGTQRLPRLVGVQTAVRWICAGRTVTAAEALAAGAIDECLAMSELEELSSSSSDEDDSSDDDSDSSDSSDKDSSSDSSSSSSSSSSTSSSQDTRDDANSPSAREDRVWTHLLGAAISFGNRLVREESLRVTTQKGKAPEPLLRHTSALTSKLGNGLVRSAILWMAARAVKAQTPPGMVSPMLALTAIRDGLAAHDFKAGLDAERAVLVRAFATPQARALQHIFFASRDVYQLPQALRTEQRVRRRRAASMFSASGSNWLTPTQRDSSRGGGGGGANSARRQRTSVPVVTIADALSVSVRSETRSPDLAPLSPAKSGQVSRRTSLSRASSMAHAQPHAPPAGFVSMRRLALFGHTRRVLRLTAAFLMNGLHVTVVPIPLFDADELDEDNTSCHTLPPAGRHETDDDVEVPLDEVEDFLLQCLQPHTREEVEALQAVLDDMSFMTPTILARQSKSSARAPTGLAMTLLQQRMRIMDDVDEEMLELDEVDIFVMLQPGLLGASSSRAASRSGQRCAQRDKISVRTLLVRLEGIARSHALFIAESREHIRLALECFSPHRLDRLFLLYSYPLPALTWSRLAGHRPAPTALFTSAIWELQAVSPVPSNTAAEALLRFAKRAKQVIVLTRMNAPTHAEREGNGLEASGLWSPLTSTAAISVTPVESTAAVTTSAMTRTEIESPVPANGCDVGGGDVPGHGGSAPTDTAETTGKATHRLKSPGPQVNTGPSPVTPLLPESVVSPKAGAAHAPPLAPAVSPQSTSAFFDVEAESSTCARRDRCSPIGLRLFARAVYPLLLLLENEQATVRTMESALRAMGFSYGAFLSLQFMGLEEVWEEICFQQSVVARGEQKVSPTSSNEAVPSSSSVESPLGNGVARVPASADIVDGDGDLDGVASTLKVPSRPIVSELFGWLLAERYAAATVSTEEASTVTQLGPRSGAAPPGVLGWYTVVVTSKPVGVKGTPQSTGTACREPKTSPTTAMHGGDVSRRHAMPTVAATSPPSREETSSDADEGAASPPAPLELPTTAATETHRESFRMVLDTRVETKLASIRQAHRSGTRVGARPPTRVDATEIQKRFVYAMLDELMIVQRFGGVRDSRALAALSPAEEEAYRGIPRALALRTADLDVLSVRVLGFPAWYGGLAYYATEPRFCSLFLAYRFLVDRHVEAATRATEEGGPTTTSAVHSVSQMYPAMRMSMLVPSGEMWTGRLKQLDRRPTVSFNTAKVDVWN